MKHLMRICALTLLTISIIPGCKKPECAPCEAKKSITAEIAIGELVDKITILKLKIENITDEAKLANIRTELASLEKTYNEAVTKNDTIEKLEHELLAINHKLWVIEDEIRECEARQDFGEKFIELARAVYITNDERCKVKRELNMALGSNIIEEKSYKDYQHQTTAA